MNYRSLLPLLGGLSFSLLLHVALLHLTRGEQSRTPSRVLPSEAIIIELRPQPAEPSPQISKQSPPKIQPPPASPPPAQISLSKLLPAYDASSRSTLGALEGKTPSPGPSKNQIQTTGSSITEDLEQHSFYKTISQKLAASIGYPQDFIDERIAGRVSLDVVINGRGEFLYLNRADGSGPKVLRAYALALSYTSLKTSIPKSYWLEADRSYPLHLTFNFKVDTFHNSKTEVQTKGPSIAILKVGQGEAIANRILAKVRDYLPPIVPVPGGVYVDFVQLYRIIDQYGKPDPESLQDERLRLTGERLDSLVDLIPKDRS